MPNGQPTHNFGSMIQPLSIFIWKFNFFDEPSSGHSPRYMMRLTLAHRTQEHYLRGLPSHF